MKNDKAMGANVASGLSERARISESPEQLGMAHKNEKTNKPMGGSPTSGGKKKGMSY